MTDLTFSLNCLKDTQRIATNLAKIAKLGDTITLSGDLGVGKTSFSQFFIKSLISQTIEVTSPTFNIVNLYQSNDVEIWHFDLYRLKNKEEAYEIGLEEAQSKAISLIEWPEIITDLLPKDRLEISFSFSEEEPQRLITIKAFGSWKQKLFYLN